jgi:hypothetical protein
VNPTERQDRERVTADEALIAARATAAAEGWPWREPVQVRRKRSWFFFGPARWEVWTNADSIGSNVRIVIDEASGEVQEKRFLSR